MRGARFFDLIGKTFAVLIFGGFVAVILGSVIATLFIASARGLGSFLHVAIVWGLIAVCFGGLLFALSPRLAKSAFGPKGQERVGNALVFIIGVAVMVAIYVFWQVPEIGDRPLSSLTLNELLENVIKYDLLFLIGSGLLRFVFSK